jgi:hypothetical protein
LSDQDNKIKGVSIRLIRREKPAGFSNPYDTGWMGIYDSIHAPASSRHDGLAFPFSNASLPQHVHPQFMKFSELSIGQSASQTIHITPEMVAGFADVTGDHNPLHTDPAYAESPALSMAFTPKAIPWQ